MRTPIRSASRSLLAVALAVCLPAETDVKKAASDYPVHAELAQGAIAAEYLVRSLPARGRTFMARDHLIVEVALFPPKGEKLAVALSQFSLRINKKERIAAQGPEFLAASFKYPDWEMRPRLEGIAGVNDGGVVVGRPQPAERFPGDPRPAQSRLPPQPRAPETQPTVEQAPAVQPEDAVMQLALRDGEITTARSGYLYFPFKGKTRSLRSVELLYQGPAGSAALRLH